MSPPPPAKNLHSAAPDRVATKNLSIEETPNVLDKRKRKKMSFSTPIARRAENTIRRSKRLSSEAPVGKGSPQRRPHDVRSRIDEDGAETLPLKSQVATTTKRRVQDQKSPIPLSTTQQSDDHSATKISLPFADTPIHPAKQGYAGGQEYEGHGATE